MENTEDKKKAHRDPHSGRKAVKKKLRNKPDADGKNDKNRNPKAFAINSAVRAERRFRRKEDIVTKKQHIPTVDKTPDVPPPVLIAIVGPPKVGKTTLIKNLIKSFTKTTVTNINGPITLVTSKKRRITLIECNNDINSMIDIAKCADLVLLLCDASFGFEMEIFEFLNICQVHGMPKIMGVLTHLDMIKNAKTLKRQKKVLKHRFWTEIYAGAKLFYLSGILHGEYLRNEITNLGRFISVMKFRPTTWRGAHSYVLADRMEDITNSEKIRLNKKCDRDIVLYGYVRGTPMQPNNMVHVAGLGDLALHELSSLPDPCPLPSAEKKRSLVDKERLLYAPMSGVGGIVYDKDAVYIELQGSHQHKQQPSEKTELVKTFIEKKEAFDVQVENTEFKLFSDGDLLKSSEFFEAQNNYTNEDEHQSKRIKLSSEDEENGKPSQDNEEDDSGNSSDDDDEISDDDDLSDDNTEDENQHSDDDNLDESDQEKAEFDDEPWTIAKNEDQNDSDDESESDDEDMTMNWKEGLAKRAMEDHLSMQSKSQNLMKLVYGIFNTRLNKEDNDGKQNSADENSEDELGGLFRKVTDKQRKDHSEKDNKDNFDTSFYHIGHYEVQNWLENKDLVQNCFVTGKWKSSEDASELLKLDDASDDDSEIFGDFEDLETGTKHIGEETKIDDSVENEDMDDEVHKPNRIEETNMTKAEILAKKLKLKAKFDSEYDNPDTEKITGDHSYYESLKEEALRQSELNKSEFATLDEDMRLQIEGFRAGLYVRLGFQNVPCEFVENFDPTYPVLIGGLNMAEENVGYVSCKVKKHRWFKATLKTADPLIVSLGWRRFQTMPIYSKIEDNMRYRYLKYTPNYITCNMHFWGPITPLNTGFCALKSYTSDSELKSVGFRIAATGAVNEMDKSTQIMKKLKLVGTPLKIFKKTAFIKDMFNSTLEVAKFEGAKIKTVSGIRGQIKKAINKPEGCFRATFEDKIKLSDIVFCRTWFKVDVPQFYSPIVNLLLPLGQKNTWSGMKTVGQLKRERGIRNMPNEDSLYKEIHRDPKVFKPLSIPKSLQKALPYRDKPKSGPIDPKKPIDKQRIAVIHSPHEQKVNSMLKMLKTSYDHKQETLKKAMSTRMEKHQKEMQMEEMQKLRRHKELKKQVFRKLSKAEQKEPTKTGKRK
ncbi:ribosome biogenesis protein BMS1 homolog isoform X1 [Ctenocephalides felis]|uniref:ribosome biogenesis protein BMS1 homolog isoform X1 n=1 Tax=Ctenocephalides felis TaxID=7515 RepID=UPI000E6E346E|nr:ribosome biogenesis protein BMS1 homolog isoform X1 [Ctenocephalides felis]